MHGFADDVTDIIFDEVYEIEALIVVI